MQKFTLALFGLLLMGSTAVAQFTFSPEIQMDFLPTEIVMPPSPLKTQILFVGGHDMVETIDYNGNITQAPAKQWHDFIGVTLDTDPNSNDYAWISVNHEMIFRDSLIGDGGGMTVFKVRRDPNTDTLIIVNQTLADGRSGQFFNVDFINTVGETGMNCGGITSTVDGRIWTAEEWFRSSNPSIYAGGGGVVDTSDFTIAGSGLSVADGQTVKKYQNFNWMVEIDPREAKAIRKQYNWGRQPFEGGAIAPDNKTVYLGADATPGFFSKFVADNAGDFTSGTLYVYKHDDSNRWVEIDNSDFSKMLEFGNEAVGAGATMFNRIEWVAYNQDNGKIYFTETGRDNPAGRWRGAHSAGAVHAPHTMNRALQQGTHPDSSDYVDYYGRVMEFDPATGDMQVFIDGGPFFATDSVPENMYPNKHLSNPDGLNFLQVNGKSFMLICEDLNGTSNGRVPGNINNRTCELFMLDMSIANPTINDLVRISIVPLGAEVTGVTATPDGKTILVNSQHPSTSNPFPYNNSLTYAITGWDQAVVTSTLEGPEFEAEEAFSIFPNPTSRFLHLNKVTDVALYDAQGQRIMVVRNTNTVDVAHLPSGVYFVQNKEGETKKLVIQ